MYTLDLRNLSLHEKHKSNFPDTLKPIQTPYISCAIPTVYYIQWNLDLTKCQGTGEIGSLYRKPQYNEFVEKQPKCSLYRGIVNNCF